MEKTAIGNLVLGVVGAGVMGRGIAQIAAQAGLRVLLYDSIEGAAEKGKAAIAAVFARAAERGRMSAAAMQDALERLHVAGDLHELAACDVVIEAIVERLDAKQALFVALEAVMRDSAILASNTSSLSVTAIAAACRLPGRVAGFHFFNPVPLMKVVEVIDGALTDAVTCERLAALATGFGHTAVRAADTPGFIVNHAGRAYGTEALQLLREGVADIPTIDRILRDVAGFRMGPFELLDLTGLDVSHAVMESIYRQYFEEPRYRPSPIGAQRVAAGLFGRKSPGGGFYRYENGAAQVAPEAPAPAVTVPPVWVSRRGLGSALATQLDALGARRIDADRAPAGALCMVAPLGEDATSAALAEELDPRNTVAVDALFGFERRRTLMCTPVTHPSMRDAAHALLASDGVPVSVIADSPGFVAQRVVAHVVNIGCDIAQQRIATPTDIDRAVTLGLGYPHGPLAWGDRLGASTVLSITTALAAYYGDPRYRPSPWLKRRAMLAVSLTTTEQR